MKKNYITIAAFIAITMGIIYTGNSGVQKTHDNKGRFGKTGSPGEATCSDKATGCHGSERAGGLADNTGGGAVVISASPAFVNNTYTPGQSYTISVTVAEQGKASFGFDFEALDNSGSIILTTNNAVGTITNGTLTKSGAAAGAKRVGVTHKAPLVAANTGVFTFTWLAPSSGIVNLYASGNAANNNGKDDVADNIYTTTLNLNPIVAAIDNAHLIEKYDLSIYPNPIIDNATLKSFLKENTSVEVNIVDINGKEIITQKFEGKSGINHFDLHTNNLSKGSYFANIVAGNDYMSYKILKK